MEFEIRKKVSTSLNIAPLIDVIFLLLIFFMLSSHFVTQPGIKITLPVAVSAELHVEEDMIVYITENSALYLNGAETSLEKLPEALRASVSDLEEKTAIIKADKKINLELAVKVMDILKQAEVKGVVISTDITDIEENAKR